MKANKTGKAGSGITIGSAIGVLLGFVPDLSAANRENANLTDVIALNR
jgi:hypothetical protein